MTEHESAASELDDLLQRRFAASAAAIGDDGFTRAVGARIRQRRRLRKVALAGGWLVSATTCMWLLADSEPLVSSWRDAMLMINIGPMSWGPALALLLLGALSWTIVQGTVIDDT